MASSAMESGGGDNGLLNYTVLVPYNETIPTGGDSLTQNLNIHYQVGISAIHDQFTQADLVASSLAISPGCWPRRPSSCSWSLVLGKRPK